MIQSAREGEDPNSPEIIEALVTSYIQRESTVMLLAVSMESKSGYLSSI